MIEGVKNSLNRMQLEYADVLFLHRWDTEVPIGETIRAANALIEDDKAFYWGTSEFSASEIMECHEYCNRYGLIPPIVEQPEYNLFHRNKMEVDFVPLFDKYGMGTTIWGPLSSGILTGKFNDGNIPEDSRLLTSPFAFLYQHRYNTSIAARKEEMTAKLQGLGKIAAEVGCSQSQLSLAWILCNKDVSTAILGASKVEQLDDSFGAIEVYKRLTPEVLEQIEATMGTRPETGINWRTWTPLAARR
jgi:aryl-alcohol dehydrogenase-like predicted oxidoreductase